MIKEGPKKQITYKALYVWKLTGKRKVIGRDFGEIIMIRRDGAYEDITNWQMDRGQDAMRIGCPFFI